MHMLALCVMYIYTYLHSCKPCSKYIFSILILIYSHFNKQIEGFNDFIIFLYMAYHNIFKTCPFLPDYY